MPFGWGLFSLENADIRSAIVIHQRCRRVAELVHRHTEMSESGFVHMLIDQPLHGLHTDPVSVSAGKALAQNRKKIAIA